MRHARSLPALLSTGLVAVLGLAGPLRAGPMTAREDEKTGAVEVREADRAVLRYNFRTVPVPDRVRGRKYAEPRSDYIHPLYGPGGEVLTADYPTDHPHHRGIYWAWPEVYYGKAGPRDLHALQGVFARPVRLVRAAGGPEAAEIEAESVWKWLDSEPIVSERARIVAHAAGADGGRFIDLEFRFTALVDGVALARRAQKLYGGLNFRSTLHGGLKMTHHADAATARPRRNFGQIVGVPAGGKRPVAVALLEHPANPQYPGQWMEYPRIAWLQPTFPRAGVKYPLKKGSPLVLRYRLWVRREAATDARLAAAWDDYAGAAE